MTDHNINTPDGKAQVSSFKQGDKTVYLATISDQQGALWGWLHNEDGTFTRLSLEEYRRKSTSTITVHLDEWQAQIVKIGELERAQERLDWLVANQYFVGHSNEGYWVQSQYCADYLQDGIYPTAGEAIDAARNESGAAAESGKD